MSHGIRNISRQAAMTSLVGIAAIIASSAAQASVVISSGATVNIACVSGVCTPSKKNAILNVTQLQNLLASGAVTVTTAGAKSSDILVSANLGWASAFGLTLDAYHSITVDKAVSVNGTGALTLTTNDGGTGGMLSFGKKGHVTFLSTANSLTINGAAFTLVADTTTLADDIASNPSGNYALASDYNAWSNPSYVTTTFNGNFQGLGHTITNLTITSSSTYAGLFAEVGSGGSIANIKLLNVMFTLSPAAQSGALVGMNEGLVEGVSVSGHIVAGGSAEIGGLVGVNDGGSIIDSGSSAHIQTNNHESDVDSSTLGGLVGYNSGVIENSYASSVIKSRGHDLDGGLVGSNFGGVVTNCYATGNVTAGGRAAVGGLAGTNASGGGPGGTITDSYSTGSVIAGSNAFVGGLVGEEGTANPDSSSYWDATTSGITSPSQGAGNISNEPGITGLSTSQLQAGLPAGFSSTIWGENSSINGGLPYLLALPPPG
jgi:hypothetical protein